MANNINTWNLTHTDRTSYGQQLRHYRNGDYKITLQNCNSIYHIVDYNFNLCNIQNEKSKSIGSLFRKINTLFIDNFKGINNILISN